MTTRVVADGCRLINSSSGSDEPVVGNVEVEPAGKSIGAGLEVLESDLQTSPATLAPTLQVAVVAEALESPVGAFCGLAQVGVASGSLVVVEFSQDNG